MPQRTLGSRKVLGCGWPENMRVIVRRERPHPGAQLTLFEARDGWRCTELVTTTTGRSDTCESTTNEADAGALSADPNQLAREHPSGQEAGAQMSRLAEDVRAFLPNER